MTGTPAQLAASRAYRARQAAKLARADRLEVALVACVDALAFLRSEGVYVWPNHPLNPEAMARAALEGEG